MSTIQLSNVIVPASAQQWLAQMLANATTLGLPVTSWQSGAVARTILSLVSQVLQTEDVLASLAAQGGFLDFAATGTVTYTNAQGQTVTVPVTPDPSIPAQWPAPGVPPLPGWLDILADGSYNCQRIGATYASGTLALTNTSGVSYGPFAAGTFHVANPTTGATYSNSASLTIAAQNLVGGGITAASNASPITITTSSAHGLSSGATVTVAGVLGNTAANGTFTITVLNATQFYLNGSAGNGAYTSGGTVNVCTTAGFAADTSGQSGTSSPLAISQVVTSLVGVSCANVAAFIGSNAESNTQLVNRCRLKLQSLSPNGAAGAYAYFALTSAQLLAALATPIALAGGTINRATVATNPNTGVVTTTVANANGAVAGVSSIAITGATNASPIVVTVGSTAGLSNGMEVLVSGVQGNTAANGYWTIAGVTGTTFQLVGSSGNAAYTTGGAVEAGDLGLVDSVIQANCVPNAVTAITQSASALNVTLAGTIYVPSAQVGPYTLAVTQALATFFGNFPIGGLATDGASNVLPIDDVIGVLYASGVVAGSTTSYVRGITGFTMNGGAIDLVLGPTQVAALVTPLTGLVIAGQ